MRLSEIRPEDVLAGKSWIMDASGDNESDPLVTEAMGFTSEDVGLFSAVVKIADGSEHLSLVVKSFPQGGDDIDIYIHTKFGWMNIHADGFMRAMGKYSHDLFPFDYYLANPWAPGQGNAPAPELSSPHPRVFQDGVTRIRMKSDEKR